MILPITFEGIGSAIKSGIAAARSIVESISRKEDAAPIYLSAIQEIINVIRNLYKDTFQLKGEMDPVARNMTPARIAAHLVSAYHETLRQQEKGCR